MKADLSELKNSFNLYFLEEDSLGNIYLSYIVFAKLLGVFLKKEIIHVTATNYPSPQEIFDKSSEDTLQSTKEKIVIVAVVIERKPKKNIVVLVLKNVITTVSFAEQIGTTSVIVKISLISDRLERCKELNLYNLCINPNNANKFADSKNSLKYTCKICTSKAYIQALCPQDGKIQLNTNVCVVYSVGFSKRTKEKNNKKRPYDLMI